MADRIHIYIVSAKWPMEFTLPYEAGRLKERYRVTDIYSAPGDGTEGSRAGDITGIEKIRYDAGLSRLQTAGALPSYIAGRPGRQEIREITGSGENRLLRLAHSLRIYASALSFCRFLEGTIPEGDEVVIYSFWCDAKALGAVLYKQKHPGTKVISRLHGGDLYDERFPGGRQPFKTYIDGYADRLVFISETGMEYYDRRWGHGTCKVNDKYVLCRLAGERREVSPSWHKTPVFFLVSCSYCAVLKRIPLLIEALSLIGDIKIRWVHFGAGEQYEEIKALAKSKLAGKDNITYELPGHVHNDTVLDYYGEHNIDAFITVSSTEGLPVSIMEAMMYGIPVIATAVGGIPEMFDHKEFMLKPDPTPEEISEMIEKIYEMPEERMRKLREGIRHRWEEMFDLHKNTDRFLEVIEDITTEKE